MNARSYEPERSYQTPTRNGPAAFIAIWNGWNEPRIVPIERRPK